MRIVIPGNPIPKKRHRCRCVQGHGQAYDEQVKQEMPYVKAQMLSAWNAAFDSPKKEISLDASKIACAESLEVHWHFYLPANESEATSQKNAKFWGFIDANGKPDFDNLIKFYCDCANGVMWSDDKIIINGSYQKSFSENPRTEIEIMSKKELIVDKKVEGVMKLFSPSQLKEFLKDASEFSTIPRDSVDEMVSRAYHENKADFLSQAAMLLSEFALKYADLLKKVQKFENVRESIQESKETMRKIEAGELNINSPIC